MYLTSSLFVFSLFVVGWGQEVEIDKNVQVNSVQRELDLTTQLVKSTVTLEIANSGTGSVHSFVYAVEKSHIPHLALIKSSLIGKSEDDTKQLKTTKTALRNVKSEDSFYKIDFTKPIGAGEKVKVQVESVFTHMLKPFPAHITQAEQQYVIYEGNLHLLSPYKLKSESITVKLSSATAESYTKVEPVKQDGNNLVYGPFTDVEAMTKKELRVHYENNAPFLVVSKLTRLIEVSHWGNIAIEEQLEVAHHGALLKGSFSRFDYQRDHRGDRQPSVKSFKTVLPASSRDVYYRDEIGNISTSNLRGMEDAVELEIRPRFPLFGGWKTNYYIGYNVPSYEYLFSSGNNFALKMRFVDNIFDNFVVDEVMVKIILPENSKNIQIDPPYKVKRLPDDKHYTYLDWVGRPVLIMQKSNLVEQHIQDFELRYSYDRTTMIFEPLMLISAFYVLFLLVIVWVRFDFTIAKDVASESRLKVQGYIEKLSDCHTQRMQSYDGWQGSIVKFKSNKDSAALSSQRKKYEAELKTTGQEITDLQTSMKAESADVAEKIAELQRLDKAVKEQLTQFTQQTERLVSGKINKGAYADTEKLFRTKFDENRDKMDNIVYAL